MLAAGIGAVGVGVGVGVGVSDVGGIDVGVISWVVVIGTFLVASQPSLGVESQFM